jgi:hypothetical protein
MGSRVHQPQHLVLRAVSTPGGPLAGRVDNALRAGPIWATNGSQVVPQWPNRTGREVCAKLNVTSTEPGHSSRLGKRDDSETQKKLVRDQSAPRWAAKVATMIRMEFSAGSAQLVASGEP